MLRPTPCPTKSRTTLRPCLTDVGFDRCTDVAEPITGSGLVDAVEQRFLGDLHQLARPRRQRVQPTDRKAVGTVANVSAVSRRHVHFDQVAALELAGPRDAVHDLVVDRHTDVSRIAKVAQRCRFCASLLEHVRRDLVKISRAHTRQGLLFEGADCPRHDLARFAHDGNLARRLEHNGVVRSRLEVHRPRVCITERTQVAFLLGLTGNIACGKSTVGHLLADQFDADYVDADRLVHALYAPGTLETQAIADRFGHELLKDDGTIDRRRLGDLVLADRAALKELEAILNPGVRKAITDRLAHSKAQVVVLDAIRLIEAGLADRCDAVWVVVCDPDAQLQRLQTSRNMTPEQASLRIAAQSPAEEKVRYATIVITNDGTLDDLTNQVSAAWHQLRLPSDRAPAT